MNMNKTKLADIFAHATSTCMAAVTGLGAIAAGGFLAWGNTETGRMDPVTYLQAGAGAAIGALFLYAAKTAAVSLRDACKGVRRAPAP